MSCPICGRIMCDHSPAERGQSQEAMMSDYYRDAGISVPKPAQSVEHLAALGKVRDGEPITEDEFSLIFKDKLGPVYDQVVKIFRDWNAAGVKDVAKIILAVYDKGQINELIKSH